ncbi:hypothetical protein [Kosakonia radicincitans]|uniref:hypothetical protein n=1 Tax=Kosakonia radicincitans TaxID=283686 RepID=UPI0022B396ED|nr:hypothetical protein [Kosakonia radicincitans]
MAQQSSRGKAVKEIVQYLLSRVKLLEDAANRGIRLSESAMKDGIAPESVISQQQCQWILQDCAMFRRWINDCDTAELRQSPDDH